MLMFRRLPNAILCMLVAPWIWAASCSSTGEVSRDVLPDADALSDGAETTGEVPFTEIVPDITQELGGDRRAEDVLEVAAEVPDLQRWDPEASLILNASVESGEGAEPAHWTPVSWGELDASFAWLTNQSAHQQRTLRVSVAARQEGDAYWTHDFVALIEGTFYDFRSLYRSDGRSRIYLHLQDPVLGLNQYFNVGQSHRSNTWAQTEVSFYAARGRPTFARILHLLDRDGWLETDAHDLRSRAAAPLPEAVVTIAFDDIWASAVTVGAAELESRSLPGLFAITRRFAQQPGQEYASIPQLQTLAASSVPHELASHSADHPFLTTVSDIALKKELADSRTFLEDLGIEVSGLAYPFGDFDHRVEQLARHQYSWVRTSLYGLNDAKTDRYRLRCFPVTSDTSLETMKGWVDEAQETGTWAILLFHDLGTPQDDNPYLTSAQDYIDLLDYLLQKGVRVATPGDVLGTTHQ